MKKEHPLNNYISSASSGGVCMRQAIFRWETGHIGLISNRSEALMDTV